jgi:hypothetical protein
MTISAFLDISALNDDDLVDRHTAAKILGLRYSTLCTWASTGRHDLPYIRCGAAVRYRIGALRQWLRERTVTHTGQIDRTGV